MGYSTETSNRTKKCMTCQYWQGRRKIRFCTSSDVRVQYDNDSSSCTAWNQSRCGNFICNRYKRWVELP